MVNVLSIIPGAICIFLGALLLLFAKPLAEKMHFQKQHQNRNTGVMLLCAGGVFGLIGVIFSAIRKAKGLDESLSAIDKQILFSAAFWIVMILAVLLLIFAISSLTNMKKKRGIVLLVITLVLFVAGGLLAPHGYRDTTGEDLFGNSSATVYTHAKQEISDQLKAPSTAKFSSQTGADIKLEADRKTWTVSGWVEAENSFGATVRNEFTITIVYSANDVYTVRSCTIK